jgi:hypothetical protein
MACDHDRFVFADTSLVLHSPENYNKLFAKANFPLFLRIIIKLKGINWWDKTVFCLKSEKYRKKKLMVEKN